VAVEMHGPGGAWFRVRRVGVLVGYGVVGVLAHLAANVAVTGTLPATSPEVFRVLGLVLLIRFGASILFDLSTSQWRFISVADVIRLGMATVSGSAALVLAARLQQGFFPMSLQVVLVDTIFYLCITGALWITYRASFERVRLSRSPRKPTVRVLVVGAGEAGNLLVREMERFPTGYHPVGFVDDDPAKQGARIHGVRVLGRVRDLAKIAMAHKADEVIIAIPSASPKELRELVSTCERSGLKFKVLPGIIEVLAGDVRVGQLRDVRIEDLLGRDPIQLELPELSADLKGRSVLITGAAGSIGSELARQVALHEPGILVLFDQAETDLFFIEMELREEHPELRIVPVIGDIVDSPTVERVFEEYKPQRVFHAAAYKHVPMMEANPIQAIRNNAIGTWKVADAAGRHGTEKFVLVSTDKAVRPANVMGATKRLAELVVLELQEKYPEMMCGAVRFGNVLGSNGSVIPIFQRQLEEGKPLTVTHPEATRYFMTIPEAVQLILQTSLLPEFRGRIAMLDMGEPVRIRDLAANLLRLSGVSRDPAEGIKYTGLRPGEKLHEELTAPDELAHETAVTKVRLLETPGNSGIKVLSCISNWANDLETGRDEVVVDALLKQFPAINNGTNIGARTRAANRTFEPSARQIPVARVDT